MEKRDPIRLSQKEKAIEFMALFMVALVFIGVFMKILFL